MSEPTRVGPPAVLRVLGVVLVFTLAFALGSTTTRAQILYGSVVGTVTDAQGATIPGALVTITSKETNLTRDTTTDNDGTYTLVNVLPGSYDLKVTLQGFREFVRTGVPVVVGNISRVEVRLEVGQLSETVTVASAVQLLQTDKAEVNTELKSAEITAMPLNQFRNYQALVNLVPGATPANFQNAETDTPARSLTTNVNGQNRNSNATRTDGATNVNIWLPHHNMYISPAETIDTVNVSTSNFDAEQGMAGGAAITVVTKSGTNEFRGSAFEFYNGEKLNARPYFFGSAAAKPDKLPVKRNIFGGTLGGPVVKNRFFFFGSYEGYKQSQNLTNFFSVPSTAMKNGDFSGAINTNGSMQLIYDPLTGNPDGTGRTPFPNNQIPASRINPIVQQLLALYPEPNTTGFGAGGNTNNFERSELRSTTRHNYDTKVNWNRTSSHQIWGKFAYLDATVDDRTYFLGPDPNSDTDGGLTKVYQVTTGHTWTLGPTMVLDSTFGFSRQDQEVVGPDQASGNFGLDVLGIPGTNDQGIGDDRYAGFPRFNVGTRQGTTGTPPLIAAAPFSTLGNFEGWMPIYRDERTYSFGTNLTKVAGAHEFRGGYLVNFLYLTHWQPELDNPRGCFDFTGAGGCTADTGSSSGVTALRGGSQTANFYNYFAQFLLGLPSTVSKSVQYEEMTTREWQHGLYFRDRWTVSPKLTLDLGVRWEYYPIMHRADRGIERVDLQTLDVLLGGRGGNPQNVGLEASANNFAPRLGVVYRMNEQSVVRTGYGITYNPIPWGRPLRGFYPATIAAAFFPNEPYQPYGTLQQGIPTITGPDLNSGRFPLPGSVDMRTPEPGNVDRGIIQTWNLAYERRLPMNLSVDVAYVGAKGDGGYADLDINAPLVVGGGNASRPYASMGRTRDLKSWGQRLKTRYHSLQLALNRPFTKGIMLKGAYTFSKSMNMADDDGWVGLEWNTLSQLHRNYALAGFDRTHNFQMGFLYQLPWRMGEGNGGGVAKAIISDWQINGVFGAFSGIPFNMSANSAAVNTPSNRQTPDLVGTPNQVGLIGASGTFYETGAWAQPTGVRFGDVGRNAFRGPGGVNLDASLFRAFPIGGTRRIEFRVEANNVTNTPKFALPNGDVTSANFMRITAIQGGFSERNVRLGVRFQF